MNIIKLDTVDSTNFFLKNLSKNTKLENFTVVTADRQLNGRGQFDSTWHSEKGKNLLFTIYVVFENLPSSLTIYLSFLTAITLRKTLSNYLGNFQKISIKWPNDILSSDGKICGILIENSIQKNKIFHSFIGIGLNVNQIDFPKKLPNATSMKKISRNSYCRSTILKEIVSSLKTVMKSAYIKKHHEIIKNEYLSHLYKFQTLHTYRDSHNTFIGRITDITEEGLLQVQKNDGKNYLYNIKEISFF